MYNPRTKSHSLDQDGLYLKLETWLLIDVYAGMSGEFIKPRINNKMRIYWKENKDQRQRLARTNWHTKQLEFISTVHDSSSIDNMFLGCESIPRDFLKSTTGSWEILEL
jgi:hypothetical protein